MQKTFNLYVPADYSFENYFLPRIKNPTLEFFPVNNQRYGVQRKGNNHLVVFLDFQLKKASSEVSETHGAQSAHPEATQNAESFNKIFENQKEVAVFSVSYHARMSAIAWKLLIDIVDNDKIMVEDDSGNIVGGPQCARDLRHLFGQN